MSWQNFAWTFILDSDNRTSLWTSKGRWRG